MIGRCQSRGVEALRWPSWESLFPLTPVLGACPTPHCWFWVLVFFGGGVPSYLSVPAGSVPGSCLGAQFTNETGNWAKSPNKVAGGGTFSLCQGPSLRPGTVLALAPCLCPLGHGAAGQHPQAMKDVRGEEEEGQGGRCDHSLGKGVSCWEAGGESLKFGLRGASWILLPWQRGSTGVHEPGKEMAALHGCQPHLGRGCPFFYI